MRYRVADAPHLCGPAAVLTPWRTPWQTRSSATAASPPPHLRPAAHLRRLTRERLLPHRREERSPNRRRRRRTPQGGKKGMPLNWKRLPQRARQSLGSRWSSWRCCLPSHSPRPRGGTSRPSTSPQRRPPGRTRRRPPGLGGVRVSGRAGGKDSPSPTAPGNPAFDVLLSGRRGALPLVASAAQGGGTMRSGNFPPASTGTWTRRVPPEVRLATPPTSDLPRPRPRRVVGIPLPPETRPSDSVIASPAGPMTPLRRPPALHATLRLPVRVSRPTHPSPGRNSPESCRITESVGRAGASNSLVVGSPRLSPPWGATRRGFDPHRPDSGAEG